MTEESAYSFLPDLLAEAEPPKRGIHSRTVSKHDGIELILFAMAGAAELSEHTAAKAAIIHVLAGEGKLVVAGDEYSLTPGAWLRMAVRTPHAVVARTPLVFALYLIDH